MPGVQRCQFRTGRDIQRMIHDFLVDSRPDKHINSSLDAVERILFTTAKHCLKIKNVKKRYTRLSSVSSNKKWFDKECRLKTRIEETC